MGHRIAKHTYNSEDTWLKSTYYVLDAQGNTMATYEHAPDYEHSTITFAQMEKHLYGSSRLGMHTEKVPMYGSQNSTYSMRSVTHHIGERTYELSNHLGNVLSVISDKVIPQQDGGGTVTLFNDEFTNAGVSLGWYYEQSATGNPPTAGYSLTFTGGEMILTAGAPFENAVKTVTIPNGASYTVSFDITGMSPVEDFYFITHDIVQLISTTGSYSFSGVGQSGPDMMGFLLAAGATIHVDNVKVTYTAPATQVYLADIRHAQCLSRPVSVGNYSPFGVTLHKRDLSLTSGSGAVPYRYGYQGSEMDNEVKGEGNSYTTEFRQLDPRLGRWLSIDPKASAMPWQSPYCSMDNNPISLNDPHGDITDKQERKLRRELKTVRNRIEKLEKQEKKWAEKYQKENGGQVIEDEVSIDETNKMKTYSVRSIVHEEGMGDFPQHIVNGKTEVERGSLIAQHRYIRNRVDGYYYQAGEVMGVSMSIGYDMYFCGGISGSTDFVFMAGETCIGGTFGGGIGFGGGLGTDVGMIRCTKPGRYRAKDIQDGEGWEFAVGIWFLEFSKSGDRSGYGFYWEGETNTTASIDPLAVTEKATWMTMYEALMLNSLKIARIKASVKYEWNKSSVWYNK